MSKRVRILKMITLGIIAVVCMVYAFIPLPMWPALALLIVAGVTWTAAIIIGAREAKGK